MGTTQLHCSGLYSPWKTFLALLSPGRLKTSVFSTTNWWNKSQLRSQSSGLFTQTPVLTEIRLLIKPAPHTLPRVPTGLLIALTEATCPPSQTEHKVKQSSFLMWSLPLHARLVTCAKTWPSCLHVEKGTDSTSSGKCEYIWPLKPSQGYCLGHPAADCLFKTWGRRSTSISWLWPHHGSPWALLLCYVITFLDNPQSEKVHVYHKSH